MKLFKKILLWGGGIFLALCLVLVVHIYMVTKDAKPVNHDLFLARVDFSEKIDSSDAAQIKREVVHLKGITNCYVNVKESTLVFGYRKGQQNPDDVVSKINAVSNHTATRFIPSEEDLAGSCPAIDKSSLTYKFGQFVKSVFS